MSDHFFDAKKCDRCGGPLTLRRMSKFNTDVLCPNCIEEERNHPDYAYAAEVERNAVRSGDYNFPGVGWPGKDGRCKR